MKFHYWQILGLAALSGLIVAWAVIHAIRFLLRSRKSKTLHIIHDSITNVLYFFFSILFVNLIPRHPSASAETQHLFSAISHLLLIAISTWLAIRIVIIFEKVILDQLDLNKSNNLQERRLYTKVKFIKRLFVILILVLAVSLLLLSFKQGREFGLGILTSAGIVSVIVGFAAQKSIGNLLAGIQIAFTQPIKIEDIVVVEGEWGQIEEINLTYVVVKIWDLRRLIIPITYFVEKPFQNWTRSTSSVVGTAFFYLNYRAPVERIREKLMQVLEESDLWDGVTAALQVTDTKDQYVVLRAIMSARNAPEAFDLRCLVREKLIYFIQTQLPEALPTFTIDDRKKGQANA